MLTLIFITSLKIVFMYGAMQEGMIFFPLRQAFIWLLSKLPLAVEQYAKKPLYDCLFCMSSVWGFIFTIKEVQWEWSPGFLYDYAVLLFGIAGSNYLIALLIGYVHTYQDAMGERIEINAPALPEPVEGNKYHIFRDGKYLGIAAYYNDKYAGLGFIDRQITGDLVFHDVDYWTEELE